VGDPPRRLMLVRACKVRVTDDWYPNYPGDRVEVSVYRNPTWVRVAVWGLDDTGMDLDTTVDSETVEGVVQRALELQDYLVANAPINRHMLAELGFTPA